MSPSEIAFLALGLVLGAAIGAALVEAVRARPAPRREVRITVSPNSISPRRATTLSSVDGVERYGQIPGSPDDDDWLERRLAGESSPPPLRTRVPIGPVAVRGTPVAIPIAARVPPGPLTMRRAVPRTGPGPDAVSGSLARAVIGTAVLDPVVLPAEIEVAAPTPRTLPSSIDVGRTIPDLEIRPRPPAQPARTTLAPTVVAVRVVSDARVEAAVSPLMRPAPRLLEDAPVASPLLIPVASAGDPAAETPGDSAPPSAPATQPARSGSQACEGERTLVIERCALADAARKQAGLAAEALREGQRAYDILRERVERAQAIADPREIRAAKDAIHRTFRTARAAASSTEAAESAARDWLNEINRLNTAAREAAHVIETGGAELRAQLPRLERLAVEADAARITAESAEEGCHEAREALARCEERVTLEASAAAAARMPREELSPRDHAWPVEDQAPLQASGAATEGVAESAAVVRILRGDRPARERLVAALAGGDTEAARQWQIRIAGLVDAISARAIEDGYLDLPDEGFWGLFTERERREIVAALSALGFRFDGLGGFADGRVPATRDLSLAVGYAGLDRMRIRIWPRETELAGLYAGASVAADEWLADEAVDLSLGRMVDALGGRAAELADVWNAWGRVRPALLTTD